MTENLHSHKRENVVKVKTAACDWQYTAPFKNVTDHDDSASSLS